MLPAASSRSRVQLGEVKAICAVLFQAKINSLDNLRRERVSDDDLKGPQTDYLPDKSVTNELAVLSPYEVSFRCFSSELAAVLAGFASSPCGLMVKTINVESAPAAPAGEQPARRRSPPRPTFLPRHRASGPGRDPSPRQSALPSAMVSGRRRRSAQARRLRRRRPYAAPPLAPASRGGLPLALDEKQLKVTLMLNAVKLVSPK